MTSLTTDTQDTIINALLDMIGVYKTRFEKWASPYDQAKLKRAKSAYVEACGSLGIEPKRDALL